MRTIECDLCGGRIFECDYFKVVHRGVPYNYKREKDLCPECHVKLFDRTTDRPLK